MEAHSIADPRSRQSTYQAMREGAAVKRSAGLECGHGRYGLRVRRPTLKPSTRRREDPIDTVEKFYTSCEISRT